MALWDLAARPARRVVLGDPAIPVGPDERVIGSETFGPGDRQLTAIAMVERRDPRMGPVTTGVFLHRWELETGRLVFSRPLPPESPGEQRHLFFSPDCTRLVSMPRIDDGRLMSGNLELRVWDIRPDGELVSLLHQKGQEAAWLGGRDEGETSELPDLEAGFTPDGKWLVIVAARQARLWRRDAPLDKPIILRGVRGFPIVAAVSEDERRLVVISDIADSGSSHPITEMKVWDLISGQELLSFSFGASFNFHGTNVKFQTFDGKRLKVYSGNAEGNFTTFDGSPRE
jgi:WD40 repeat protein